MNHNITIDIEPGGLLGRHDGWLRRRSQIGADCAGSMSNAEDGDWRQQQQRNLPARRLGRNEMSRDGRERTEMQPVTQPALQKV